MLDASEVRRALDELAFDVDMLVYQLERTPLRDPDALIQERESLRRDLERLKERLEDLSRAAS